MMLLIVLIIIIIYENVTGWATETPKLKDFICVAAPDLFYFFEYKAQNTPKSFPRDRIKSRLIVYSGVLSSAVMQAFSG